MNDHELLEKARHLPHLQQQQFLANACGDDAERLAALQQRLQELNQPVEPQSSVIEKGTSLFSSPLIEAVAQIDPKESVPVTKTDAKAAPDHFIGPFRLVRMLGKGGMGEVWQAWQDLPVKRSVALKVIKPGIGSREIMARFDVERQALALMNHPNIARILDAATTSDGQPYFAMELVQGETLTNYCDQQELGIDQRLELFMAVCHGVQHAHQKGIIHRDLKPSNVLVSLVDGKPVPKVIDFGLAKALDSTQRLSDQSLFTGIGQILGTLKYMSPEQAGLDSADIDTRTDIYALGVILYELLTGSTPLDESSIKGQAALKVLEFIRDQEAIKPSRKLSSSTAKELSAITSRRKIDSVKLNRLLAGDLDWIVMKALEKDRRRRYESASGFAEDIQRYLHNEPVVARPPTLNYRLQKFIRKNRWFVGAATLLLLTLAGGIVGTSVALNRALEAEKLADRRFQEAEESRQKEATLHKLAEERQVIAETNAKSAREQSQLALSTLNAVVSDIVGGLRNVPGGSEVRRKLLQVSLQKLQLVSVRFLAQSQVDRSNMVAISELGDLVLDFGIDKSLDQLESTVASGQLNMESRTAVELAGDFYMRAHEIAKKLAEAEPDNDEAQLDFSVTLDKLADVCKRLGRTTEAQHLYVAALKINRQQLDRAPNEIRQRMAVATSLERLGQLLAQMSRSDEGIEYLQEALTIRRSISKEAPADRSRQTALSITLESLGRVQLDAGHTEDALEQFEASYEIQTTLAQPDSSDVYQQRGLVSCLLQLGDTYWRTGKTKEGIQKTRQALEKCQLLAAQEPTDDRLRFDLSECNTSLAVLLEKTGQLSESLPYALEHLKINRMLAQEDPNNVLRQINWAVAQTRYGSTLIRMGRNEEALALLEEAFEICQEVANSDPNNSVFQSNLSIARSKLGYAQQNLGQIEEAIESYEKSIEIDERLADQDPEDVAKQLALSSSYSELGYLFQTLGDYPQSLKMYRRSARIHHKLVTVGSPTNELRHHLWTSHLNVGFVLKRLQQYEQSSEELKTALEIILQLKESDSDNANYQKDLQYTYQELGETLCRLKKVDEGLAYLQKSLVMVRDLNELDPGDAKRQESYSTALSKVADALLIQGKTEEALLHYKESLELAKTMATEQPRNIDVNHSLWVSYNRIGELLLKDSRVAEATNYFSDGLQIIEELASLDKKNIEIQRGVMISHHFLGLCELEQDNFAATATHYEQGIAALDALQKRGQNSFRVADEKADMKRRLRAVKVLQTALGDFDELLKLPDAQSLEYLEIRAIECCKRKQFAVALQATRALTQLPNAKDADFYNSACVLCLCAVGIEENQGIEVPGEKAETLFTEAIECLEKSIKMGWDDFEHLQKDSDLLPLHDRPEFNALLRLEKEAGDQSS